MLVSLLGSQLGIAVLILAVTATVSWLFRDILFGGLLAWVQKPILKRLDAMELSLVNRVDAKAIELGLELRNVQTQINALRQDGTGFNERFAGLEDRVQLGAEETRDLRKQTTETQQALMRHERSRTAHNANRRTSPA